MLFKRKHRLDENIIKEIYKKGRLKRWAEFLLGVLIVAIAYNLFLLPAKVVYGVGGLGIIFNSLFKIDPSLVILVSSVILLFLSLILLGKEETKKTVIGSLLYPVFVKLTSSVGQIVDLSNTDPLLIVLFGAVISGFGLGLIFKAGFTTGGTDILNQIVSKYFKMSMGNSMFFTDGIIILSSVFVFGWTKICLLYTSPSPRD